MINFSKDPISNAVKNFLIISNLMEFLPVLVAMILRIYFTSKMKLTNDNTNPRAMMKKIAKTV